jgi:single-strand DNA-binding protein
MANLNKVILIGRIVADPTDKDVIPFQNGGKVTKLRFVVNNRKPDPQAQGQWVDDPVWLDLKFFNRGEFGKLADRAAQLRKPQQICLEGHLVMEEWTDQQGQKRQKIVVYVDSFQLIDRRDENGGGGNYGGGQSQRNTSRTPAAVGGGRNGGHMGGSDDGGSFEAGSGGGGDDDIPF